MEKQYSSDWLVLLMFLSCSYSQTMAVLQFRFHRVLDIDGVLPSTDPLFHVALISKRNCAVLCGKHDDCQAFTFVGDKKGSCYGFSSFTVSPEVSSGSGTGEIKTYVMDGVPATTQEGCQVLHESDNSEGVIQLWANSSFLGRAICSESWLVFQRRHNGKVDFYRDWDHYRDGFGRVEVEYWLGLETVRQLTSHGSWNLRVDLKDKNGNSANATFSNFSLGSEDSFYTLQYDSYAGGTAGDSLADQALPFSTRDRDNDGRNDASCAVKYHGAWWYKACHRSNLNGDYNNENFGTGLNWKKWKGYYHSMSYTQIKIQQV